LVDGTVNVAELVERSIKLMMSGLSNAKCELSYSTHLSEVGDEDNKLARAPASFNDTLGNHEGADQQTHGDDEVLDQIEQVERH
jgi:hypothetical protein